MAEKSDVIIVGGEKGDLLVAEECMDLCVVTAGVLSDTSAVTPLLLRGIILGGDGYPFVGKMREKSL